MRVALGYRTDKVDNVSFFDVMDALCAPIGGNVTPEQISNPPCRPDLRDVLSDEGLDQVIEGVVFGDGLTEAEIKIQRPQPKALSDEESSVEDEEIIQTTLTEDGEARITRERRPRKKTPVFSDIAEHGDDTTLVIPVKERLPDFDFDWVSRAAGTRGETEMVDKAAELVGDLITGRKLKINADFRGFRDMVDQVQKEFNPANDQKLQSKILENVKDWYATQLVEAILAVRGLRNQGTWLRDDVEVALSSKALTAVAMCRPLVREKIRSSLLREIGKTKAA